MFTSPHFRPIALDGRNLSAGEAVAAAAEAAAGGAGIREGTLKHIDSLPLGAHTFWGMPFDCGDKFIYVNKNTHKVNLPSVTARYLVFLHASETPPPTPGEYGIFRNYRGDPRLMEHICDYIIHYSDGTEIAVPIRARMEINDMSVSWGQGALMAHPHTRGRAIPTVTDETRVGAMPESSWGHSQTRVVPEGSDGPLRQWVFAYENPTPDKAISSIDIVKKGGNVFLFAITAGDTASHPLRYGRRQKAVMTLNGGDQKRPLELVDIDLGHIISVTPRLLYPNDAWEQFGPASPAKASEAARISGIEASGAARVSGAEAGKQYIVEYNAHEDALLYANGEVVAPAFRVIPAERYVTLRVRDKNGAPVPVKVHAHGAAGEYLPPRNRHRIPNPYWFEDYSADNVRGDHWSTYIDGTAEYLLPLGEVFFEVSKGFETKPQRKRFVIGPETEEIRITLDRVIDWRSKGWVTADTHVHFLSPQTALLEGEAEGVNVVNLLASQWGELFTNIGDFTGAGEISNGEHMVRVGTENRQHLLGHISLLGYDGAMILPLTTDGPDESALGDPMEMTLTQWAAQCRAQNGLSIIPHFPFPRAEAAAAIVSELIDGVETVLLGGPGISPYYLSDWYRYLNCGYHVAAVGGTDKMSAGTAIGEMRTYALLDGPLTYQTWKDAVASGRTFATSGALVDMRVENTRLDGMEQLPAGAARLGGAVQIPAGGARIAVEWDVASAVMPITSLELVMNGETVDGVKFDGLIGEKSGHFDVNIKDSAWLALRVRGKPVAAGPVRSGAGSGGGDGSGGDGGRSAFGSPEVITAHTSAIFVIVDGKPLFNGPDAATILDQIEGATAYVKSLATKAQEAQFKLAIAALSGAHRALHNRMHAAGHYHNHSAEDKHPGH
ncbi:MAG: CehA/McbA family metallohydrolase [Oscillospiraceae bacterium]|nr:CehA/McbA family metallohydrolase [Oscillospiraceae bacterium]